MVVTIQYIINQESRVEAFQNKPPKWGAKVKGPLHPPELGLLCDLLSRGLHRKRS